MFVLALVVLQPHAAHRNSTVLTLQALQFMCASCPAYVKVLCPAQAFPAQQAAAADDGRDLSRKHWPQ